MAFTKQHFVDGSTLITAAWLNGIQEVVGAAAVVPEYDNAQVYAVGALCSYDGNMYRCITAITVAEDWNPAHWESTSITALLNEKENVILMFTNKTVATNAWGSWVYQSGEQTLHDAYPFRATVSCSGATATMLPEVTFDYDALATGNLAPIASSGANCVYIYAKTRPSATTKILNILLFRQ